MKERLRGKRGGGFTWSWSSIYLLQMIFFKLHPTTVVPFPFLGGSAPGKGIFRNSRGCRSKDQFSIIEKQVAINAHKHTLTPKKKKIPFSFFSFNHFLFCIPSLFPFSGCGLFFFFVVVVVLEGESNQFFFSLISNYHLFFITVF